MDRTTPHNPIYWDTRSDRTLQHELVGEEPLSIRVQGNPYSVVMRTPGDDLAHVAGFCLGEGIIDTRQDLVSIGRCDGEDSNVVAITLTPQRRENITEILDRREFISQTSCGICGKHLVKDLYQLIKPVTSPVAIDFKEALNRLEEMAGQQPLRQRTRASHAALLYTADFELLASAEDVGRHNAMDKAIGRAFLDETLHRAAMVVMSSRISYELVQKAARARIPIIMAVSRPTSLAVQLAAELNMALASLAPKIGGAYIYCGQKRLKR